MGVKGRATLLEGSRTEKLGAVLTRVRFSGGARDFSASQLLTLSLPRRRFKTTDRSAGFETLKPFFFFALGRERISVKSQTVSKVDVL